MNKLLTVEKFYGAHWCVDCKRSRDFLDAHKISYNFIDIDSVTGAADDVARLNNGYKIIPTIVFSDGTILQEPSNKQLATKLGIVS